MNEQTVFGLPKWIKLKHYCAQTGYSLNAGHKKRYTDVWIEGEHWVKNPAGEIMVSPAALDAWNESAYPQKKKHRKRTGKPPVWIKLKTYCESVGYTLKTGNQRRYEGHWIEGVQWVKNPAGEIMVNPATIDGWNENVTLH